MRPRERAGGDLASLRGETPERLCIGITPWLGQTLLAPTVAAFRELMPGRGWSSTKGCWRSACRCCTAAA
jgi:DNA-binding transcriptional LysR family regulator